MGCGLKALGMTAVSRLRKDAALRTLPGPRPTGKRGRPRTYGEHVIGLAKRGGQKRGWTSETLTLYGVASVKKYKRAFTPEFKAEAVKLVTEGGRSFVEVARDLD